MTVFEPRPAATIRTLGVPRPEQVEDKSVDEEKVQAKVVTPPSRKGARTTRAETK